MTSYCPTNHAQTWKCHEGQPLACYLCELDTKRASEKREKDFELQKKRDAEQQMHDEKMAKIREMLDAQIQAQKDLQLAKEREVALKQQEQDVKDAEERLRQKAEAEKGQDEEAKRAVEWAATSSSSIAAAVIDTVKSAADTLTGASPKKPSTENTGETKKESEAQSDWQRRKNTDGAANPHIDAIMEMIGLEPVKQQVLKIMDKVEVNIRQGTSLAKERFNVVFLGNPGTGIIRLVVRCGTPTNNTLQERLPWRGTMPNS